MKKPGRNDPCPCSSGKKYKQCCLKTEEAQTARAVNDRSEAVPRAINWLMSMHGLAVREALDERFFGSLDDDEYEMLQDQHADVFPGVMVNAMEWLLAEGSITVRGQERRVSELLLGRGGPLFSVEQRKWIELLTSKPLGLYEVIDVVPGEGMSLRDILFPEQAPVLVKEKSGSRDAVKFDLMAARILPVDDHHELSGAVYSIPRHRSLDLIAELRHELEGVAPDSPDAKEILSVIIPAYWLELFTSAFEIPEIVDHVTGEPILLITDHYRVQDWDTLDEVMAGQEDVEGNRAEGWARLFEGADGLLRSRLTIDPGRRPDRVKVSYHTQKYADEGRPWFDGVAGSTVVFISREISDPKGILSQMQPGEVPAEPSATAQLSPDVVTEVIGQRIRQLYANWANQPLPALDDRTPREAIKTSEGLEQVKFLLRTYEHGEVQQAKDQHRSPVSFDFLWHELGIAP
jgi:hypothetical protein